jgi:hypothetical protein
MTKCAVAAVVIVSLMGCGSSVDISAFDQNEGGVVDSGNSGADAVGTDSGAATDAVTTGDTTPADTFDPTADGDGDGYKAIDDCNDGDPTVNPGAFDVPGDKIDNDCSGKADDDTCDDGALALDSTEAADLAKAIGICRTTTEEATGKSKTWGLLSAKVTRADGSGTADDLQHGIMSAFGKNVAPRQGKSLLVLSTGAARTPSQAGYVASHSDDANATPAPDGFPKSGAGCPEIKSATAYDGISVELELRVPTNAKGFRIAHDFYTAEYIDQVCTGYDDHFLVLLQSTAPLDAKYSGNVVFDAMGDHITTSTPFLEICTPGTSTGTPSKSWACPQGTKELQETGFQDSSKPGNGAATGWLETQAAVVPGETIKVRFVIFDAGDHIIDSSVLLDAFRWTTTAPSVPVTSKASK